MNRWFRFYNEALDDPKVQLLPPELFKAWVNLLCLASQNDGTFPETFHVAFRLRCSEEQATLWLDELRARGLVDGDAPHKWKERQYASDSSTARVRKHREKQAAETPAKQPDEHETFHVTPPEQTQSRTDTEKKGKARGTRFTLESLPADWDEWARSEGFGAPGSEFDRFADYWRAQPGQKGVKTDWFATWRNWIRRALEDGRGREVEAPSKSRQPRPVVTLSWSGGDLPALRNRLRSATGSAWSVYLDRLVPSEPGETSGPAPPDSAMREVWRWAEHYGVAVEASKEAA